MFWLRDFWREYKSIHSQRKLQQDTFEQKQNADQANEPNTNQDSDSSYLEEDELKKKNLIESEYQCGICLENPNLSTATGCGHIFCWQCINKALIFKEECPRCRQPCKKKEIVLLTNL